MAVNSIRFSGLASGLDTESMVNAMLSTQKYKVDSTKQQQQLLQLKKDKWKEVNNKLLNFQKNILDTMKLTGNFNKTTTTVSNSDAIALDKNVIVAEGTHSIEITQMAAAAAVSTSSIAVTDGKDTNLGLTEEYKLSVNGKIISIDSSTTIKDVETDLKGILGDKTVKFDEKIGAFIIATQETGASQAISIGFTDADGNNLSAEAKSNLESKLGIKEGNYTGKDAQIIYNGGVSFTSSTNQNIEINGIKFNILSKTTQPVGITATKDTEQVVDFIKNFVKEYNALVEEMNTLVDAPKNKSYMPLTSDQKSEMTEDDIKLWNEKINTSLLSGDQQLKGIISETRRIVGEIYDGDSLSEIGITTGNWKENGKLNLNEDKLRKALLEDSDQVIKLISTVGKKLNEDFNNRLKGSTIKSSNSFYNDKQLDADIKKYNEKIEDLEDKYTSMETIYYAKFTAMEKAMSQLNNQSNWLASQLGGM